MTNKRWPVGFGQNCHVRDYITGHVGAVRPNACVAISRQQWVPPLRADFTSYVAVLVPEVHTVWKSYLHALQQCLKRLMGRTALVCTAADCLRREPLTFLKVRYQNVDMDRVPAGVHDPEGRFPIHTGSSRIHFTHFLCSSVPSPTSVRKASCCLRFFSFLGR